MLSPSPPIERAKPLLGTLVSIRAAGGDTAAIEAAFAEIALIHELMSFHSPDSELSRLNRGAHLGAIVVHPHTAAVLRLAARVAEASGGAFNITVAAELARWGLLPKLDGARPPVPGGDWRDIEIGEDDGVTFRRPLWIDLGGIAKGYAVDRAVEILLAAGATQGCVNAGGDLRVFGPETEMVALRTDLPDDGSMPAIQVSEGSLASSSGAGAKRRRGGLWRGPHVDPWRKHAVGMSSFACVAAQSCAIADALTKVVLIGERRAEPALQLFSAEAHFYDRRWGWRHLGEAS